MPGANGNVVGGCNAHRPREEIIMTKSFVLPLAMAISIALTCVSFAQTMAPQGGNMSNTSSDKMTKPDTMGKTDGMKKDEKTDGMKKADDKTDAMKKDSMAK
jgi:pentapeptide MXKDX repeat protein